MAQLPAIKPHPTNASDKTLECHHTHASIRGDLGERDERNGEELLEQLLWRIKVLTEALGTTAIDLTEKKNRACFSEVLDECDWPGPRASARARSRPAGRGV
jgi:hypothetical protein